MKNIKEYMEENNIKVYKDNSKIYKIHKEDFIMIDLNNLNSEDNKVLWRGSIGKTIKFTLNEETIEVTITSIKNKKVTLTYKDKKKEMPTISILRGNVLNTLKYFLTTDIIVEDVNLNIGDTYKDFTIKDIYYNTTGSSLLVYDNVQKREREIKSSNLKYMFSDERKDLENFNKPLKNTTIENYIVNIEDLENTVRSTKSILLQCPNCKHKRTLSPQRFFDYGFMCSCTNNYSFGERMVVSYLQTKEINYIKEYTIPNTRYRFDFYLPDTNQIIEVNGIHHYEESYYNNRISKGRHKGTVERDRLKKGWALTNGMDYIVVEAKKSEYNYIKNSMERVGFTFDGYEEDIKNNLIDSFYSPKEVKDVVYYLENTVKTYKEISEIVKVFNENKIESICYNFLDRDTKMERAKKVINRRRKYEINKNFNYDVVKKKYEELGTYVKTAEFFGTSRQTITRLIKKGDK